MEIVKANDNNDSINSNSNNNSISNSDSNSNSDDNNDIIYAIPNTQCNKVLSSFLSSSSSSSSLILLLSLPLLSLSSSLVRIFRPIRSMRTISH